MSNSFFLYNKKAGADMHFAFQLRLVEGAVIYFPTFAVSSTW